MKQLRQAPRLSPTRWISSNLPRTSFKTISAADTEELGVACSALLHPGDVVLVSGELGVGKTTFIRGACRGLGINEGVTSPSFVIGHTYEGDASVAHIDLYRIDSFEGEDHSILDDYITADRVSFVEWPKSGAPIPIDHRMQVHIEYMDGDRRTIEIEGEGPLPEAKV